MPSSQTIFSCSKCGAQYPKWQGRCLECGSWSTIQEQAVTTTKPTAISPDEVLDLGSLPPAETNRLATQIQELDRVLGGGIVPGSLILVGGDPGVGKSTLCLQIAQKLNDILYVSGEESANQIKLRAQRINLNLSNLKFLPQTIMEKVISTIEATNPKLVIIDSIQTMRSLDASVSSGQTSQIIAATGQLLETAKKTGIPIIIIGHVTKEGLVAGPKTLEHLVDTVLYLENDNKNFYKILRSNKNRFGSTGEIGVFEMTSGGLSEVTETAQIFLQDETTNASGNVTTAVMEGQRPFFLEVQALVDKTVFGYPQRKSAGFDLNRLQMIIAVLSKIAKINLLNQDIYLNITGGLKIKDSCIDLAVAAAILSAFLELPIDNKFLIFGELGLDGGVRSLPQSDKIIKEAKRLKFKKIILPAEKNLPTDQAIIPIKDIKSLISAIK